MFRHILILCIGNICRSPMAEALFYVKCRELSLDVRIESAGINAMVGYSAHKSSQLVMQKKGIDISMHKARQVTLQMLREADLILTMTMDQKQGIEHNMPSLCGRVYRLGEHEEFNVNDPFQRPLEAFEDALVLIEMGVNAWCRCLI